MVARNCWEFLQCGREQGGRLSAEGVCPCAIEGEHSGRNGGDFAGRCCWKVVGTMCHGTVQESLADKLTTCIRCDFYRAMRDEAGDGCEVSLLWGPELEFGIPLVDGQHRRLVQNLEDILAATGDTHEVLARCLGFLVKYTHEHFQSEERLMARHGYPGLAEHAAAHASFRDSLARAVKLVARADDPAESTRLVKSMMVNWYVNHITGMDQQYSEYFHQNDLVRGMR